MRVLTQDDVDALLRGFSEDDFLLSSEEREEKNDPQSSNNSCPEVENNNKQELSEDFIRGLREYDNRVKKDMGLCTDDDIEEILNKLGFCKLDSYLARIKRIEMFLSFIEFHKPYIDSYITTHK